MKLSTTFVIWAAAGIGTIVLSGMARSAQAVQTQPQTATVSQSQHPQQASQMRDSDGETKDDTTSVNFTQPTRSHTEDNAKQQTQTEDANDGPNDADSSHEDAH